MGGAVSSSNLPDRLDEVHIFYPSPSFFSSYTHTHTHIYIYIYIYICMYIYIYIHI
jgi:hypothetical protein